MKRLSKGLIAFALVYIILVTFLWSLTWTASTSDCDLEFNEETNQVTGDCKLVPANGGLIGLLIYNIPSIIVIIIAILVNYFNKQNKK